MKLTIAAAFLASAATATVFQPGSVPTCHVDGNGHTVVHFDAALHPSFHCSHNAANTKCTCAQHPTHHHGGCKSFVHTDGTHHNVLGKCDHTGENPVDCVGSWSGYSACNKSCGSGAKTRTYTVTTPKNFNGQACPFANGEKQSPACNTHPCPINGGFTPFTPFSACTHGQGDCAWEHVKSLVSAGCSSLVNPPSDPGACCGEPAGTCLADESANVGKMFSGGEANLRAASGSLKTYTMTFKLDGTKGVRAVHVNGRSTGHHAHSGKRHHNDLGFRYSTSLDGQTFGTERSLKDCSDLSRNTCTSEELSAPEDARYIRVRASSSCAGCINNDFVSSIAVLAAGMKTKTRTCTNPAPQFGGAKCSGSTSSTVMCGTCVKDAQFVPFSAYTTCTCPATLSPVAVTSATCVSTIRPASDPGACCGEPSGTCNGDESGNMRKMLSGGEANFRAASGSRKDYYVVLDYGTSGPIEKVVVSGRSTGHHAFSGRRAHNDLHFKFQWSDSASGPWQGDQSLRSCSDLGQGKCDHTFSSPITARYIRLKAGSSCAGCVNNDYVKNVQIVRPSGPVTMQGFRLKGRSTGYLSRHNDNYFRVYTSTDGTTFGPAHSMGPSCSDLGNGKCGTTFSPPITARYVKVWARSSCAGCVNADYVSAFEAHISA